MGVLMALALSTSYAPPATALTSAEGCLFELDLQSGSNVNVGLLPPTWAVDGDGTCWGVPGADVDGVPATLDGTLTGVAMASLGCAGGVYLGNLTFTADSGTVDVDSTLAAAVMVGPVLHITMASSAMPTFAGTGVFAETSTGATLACITTVGNTSTTWLGGFGAVGLDLFAAGPVRPGSGETT